MNPDCEPSPSKSDDRPTSNITSYRIYAVDRYAETFEEIRSPIILAPTCLPLKRENQSAYLARSGGVIRKEKWKLIEHFENHGLELYNVQKDISEKHNLANRKPRVLDSL